MFTAFSSLSRFQSLCSSKFVYWPNLATGVPMFETLHPFTRHQEYITNNASIAAHFEDYIDIYVETNFVDS